MTTTVNDAITAELKAFCASRFKQVVAGAVGDYGAEGFIDTDDSYVVRVSTGQEFRNKKMQNVLAEAHAFWSAHKRLMGIR